MPAEIYGPLGALVVLAFVVMALIRGEIIPGFIYKAEVLQRQKAEAQAEQNTQALADLARAAANGAANGTPKRAPNA